MHKHLLLLSASVIATPSFAAPEIMGLRSGISQLGTPSPTPTPSGLLVPGATPPASWTTPTPTPSPQGSSSEPLYSTPAIGQWVGVPYQPTTATDKQVCVAAFHAPTPTEYSLGSRNAIAKVSFIANNGTPLDVMTTTISNPSGKALFCADLDDSGLSSNSPVEIRAVIWPTTGIPLVLQGPASSITSATVWSMFLQAKRSATRYYLSPTGSDSNPCTSSQPCLTVLGVKNQVGAGDYSAVEVCLNAGTYDIDGGTTDRTAASGFMTITPCPGVSKSSVTISAVSNRAPRVTKTLVKGVLMSGISNWNAANGTALWLDDVDIDGNCKGSSGCVPVNVNGGNFDDGVFMTNTLVTDYFEGSPNLKLVRNVTVDNINQDSFKHARV